MRNTLATLLVVTLFLSCSKENKSKNPLYYANDFESTIGWVEHSTLTTGDNAHSGRTFAKTTPESPYSFGFHRFVKDLSTKRVKKAEFNAWVNPASAESKGNLVLAVDTAGTNIFWVGMDIKNFGATPGKWTQIKGKATLPMNLPKNADLKIYYWNTGTDAVLIDDFEITFKD